MAMSLDRYLFLTALLGKGCGTLHTEFLLQHLCNAWMLYQRRDQWVAVHKAER